MLKHNLQSAAVCILAMRLLAAACCTSVASAGARLDPPATRGENLVPNGDFEKGKTIPERWQAIDGLATFWVDAPDPARGKVIKLDTDVLQSQAYEWWAKILENAEAKDAPNKQATVEPKYDTLAGLDGVWFWSDFIPVEKGKSYWLTVDVKGPGMKVFMRGYPDKESTAFGADEAAFQGWLLDRAGKFKNERGRTKFKQKYIWSAWMPAGGSDQWQTYSRREMPFSPTKNTPSVNYVRVMIYPYWPPATYYVDNVKLLEVLRPDAR